MDKLKIWYTGSSDQNWDLIRDQGPSAIQTSNGKQLFTIFYNKTILAADAYKQPELIFIKGNLDE